MKLFKKIELHFLHYLYIFPLIVYNAFGLLNVLKYIKVL